MKLTSTHWTTPSNLSARTGIPYRTLWRLVESGKGWKGWVVMRREIGAMQPSSPDQKYVWKAFRIGKWRDGVIVGDLEIPAEWFGALSKIRTGQKVLDDIRDLEDDLGLMMSGGMSGTLSQDRLQAVKQIEEGVSTLTKDGAFEGFDNITQVMSLFQPFKDRLIPHIGAFSTTNNAVVSEDIKVFPFKSLLIIGGKSKADRDDQLIADYNLDALDHEIIGGNGKIGIRNRIKNGRYDVVVIMSGLMAHKHTEVLKDVCKDSDTPYFMSPSASYQTVKDGLDDLASKNS